MANIKQHFGIKELELLSGIKAHTIRIWEKRYNILSPTRTDTNIRIYDNIALQRLLNVALLNKHGYKISYISTLSTNDIKNLIHQKFTHQQVEEEAIKQLKVAMINYDETLFTSIYQDLKSKKSFRTIFLDIFLPLLHQTGLLWQTKVINPAQEHFLSHLIRQKLYLEIEKNSVINLQNNSKTFVLFLPEEEIHDLGLLYLNYELLNNGYKTIFLGHSIPKENLITLKKLDKKLCFVSYLTIKPDDINDYTNDFSRDICVPYQHEYWLLGNQTQKLNKKKLPYGIKIFENINQFIQQIS
ncbi:MerR family transcriptional regulator [Mesonia sp. K7]|uniref:MerR family transcriptional regulator n=1 Tax=Mesonia sp. K7 TaxID=2218606 RepID=UPI000DA7B189|nr:MerR family transcriptional regulator [Mesonia sp. K7]PZD77869.1 MerR family transcriptional regulator [Mesonia sp. K7]